MPPALPGGVEPGCIFLHPRFYRDTRTGAFVPKYLAVLAAAPGGDIVFRLQPTAWPTPESPLTSWGPVPSFYLGVLGGPLGKDSWLDLRGSEDYDSRQFGDDKSAGKLTRVAEIPESLLRASLECGAAAPDTRVAQEKAIRDHLALANR